jgi:hypothetical protein
MPYDPQRSHRRPQVSDDGPVPVDALLDPAETTESGPEVTPRPEPVAATATAAAVVEPAAVFDEIEVTAATQRSRPRLVLLAAALLVALLLLAWVRRRR